MVFERYIYKHGKKLGPYYYENVRSPDGRVKTVYVGRNPSNHSKHKIKKPLFFLIIVLILILILGSTLFFLNNKAYLIKKVKQQEPDFDVDQILLKVLIRSNEFIEKQIRVMNTGNDQATINIEASGLSDIVQTDSRSFAINPGQTKIVTLNFSSFITEQKIEQQPGVYVGKLIVKSQKASIEIPIVAEIETKNVLFDMNLNPVAIERKVNQGSDTTIEVRVFNLQSIESANVDVEYFVKDMNGNTIQTESETVVVKTQASFFKTVSIPKNLKPGPYVFAAQARFGNSIGTASYLFDVVGPEAEASFVQFCKNNVLCLGLSLITILLLFALTAYFYFFIGAYLYEKFSWLIAFPRKEEEKEIESLKEAAPSGNLRKFYRILDEAKKAIDAGDASKVDKLYIKARDLYVDLADQEKREIYDKLMELHDKKDVLAKENSREDLKRTRELRLNELEKERLLDNRKKKFIGFLGKIKLYKTPEERKRIALQKEKEIIEELNKQKKLEELKAKEDKIKLNQEEKTRLLEERKQEQEILRKQKEAEAKKREEEEISKKLGEERKAKFKDFFHKIGLYKTSEEKQQIALQKEKEKQKKIRREEESKLQRELELKKLEQQRLAKEKNVELEAKRKHLEEERREKDEQKNRALEEKIRPRKEKKRQKELEKQRAEEEKRKEEQKKTTKEGIRKQKEIEKKLEEKKEKGLELELKERPEEIELLPEKKASIFSRLFSKKEEEVKDEKLIPEEIENIPEIEKQRKKSKPKSEAEELEAAIRSLDLFKRIEEGKVGVKEKHEEQKPSIFGKLFKKKEKILVKEEPIQKSEARKGILEKLFGKKEAKKPQEEKPVEEMKEKFVKPEKKIIGRSKKFEKCYKILNDVKESIADNDITKAKKLYIEARKQYVGLDYSERKEIYDELMELYRKLR